MTAARQSSLPLVLLLVLLAAGSLGCSSAQQLYPGPEKSPADVAVLSLPKSTMESLKAEDGSLVAGKDALSGGGRVFILPGSYVLEGTVFADVATGQTGHPDPQGTVSTEITPGLRAVVCRLRFTAEAGKEYVVTGFNSLQILDKSTGKVVCRCEE